MTAATKDTEEKSEATAASLLLAVTIGPPVLFYRAWAVSWMWFWFVVPFGVPVIGAVHAFGLLSVYRLALWTASGEKGGNNSPEAIARGAVQTLVVTTVSLGLAYLAALHIS